MKKIAVFSILLLSFFIVKAQDAKELQEHAKEYTRQGDFDNAILLLVKALEQSPSDAGIIKDLALNYFFEKENSKALETIKPLLDKSDADDQSYQIAGTIYKATNQNKEAEILYKKGIKKFPKSGALYSEYGELLSLMQNTSAINLWEKGIEMDATYSGNYYNAAKYYYFTTDKIWSIIYAEIFINIDPLSSRTTEIKSVLLDSYKKLFSEDIMNDVGSKNNKNGNKINFEQAFLQCMNKARDAASAGINPESLIMIRTRFILDWYEKYAPKFPFKLFDYHKQLLQEGIFAAYNQWIFGSTQNLTSYQTWTSAHVPEYTEFNNFQKGRVFKMPQGQYYHK